MKFGLNILKSCFNEGEYYDGEEDSIENEEYDIGDYEVRIDELDGEIDVDELRVNILCFTKYNVACGMMMGYLRMF